MRISFILEIEGCDHWNLKSHWWKMLRLGPLLRGLGLNDQGSLKGKTNLYFMLWIMVHALPNVVSRPPQNRDHDTSKLQHNPWFMITRCVEWSRKLMKWFMIESVVRTSFSYALKGCDHTKVDFNYLWHGLGNWNKDPHNSWSRPLGILYSVSQVPWNSCLKCLVPLCCSAT